MTLYLVALLAGMLTVITPCVLPILPVILGGALAGQERYRPLVISLSLMASVFLFTLVLKVSTAFINVPAEFWTYLAGGIVLLFGLTMLFPNQWFAISQKMGFEESQKLIQSASQQGGMKGMVLLGMALGPVFASCSPTYALILAVVLPQDFTKGLIALLVYCFGLFVPLFLIAYVGRSVLASFRWFANPNSLFRRGLGLLLIVIGLLVLTGFEKKLEQAVLDNGYFDFTKLEQGLVEKVNMPNVDMPKIVEMAKEQNVQMPTTNVQGETDEDRKVKAMLNVNYPAPELVDPQDWINSKPLSIAGLKGKVVVVDFWTYSCINCIRTLPAIRDLYDNYKDQGLVVLGVHAPEFAFERVLANVQAAVDQYQLKYPIFLDNDHKTWAAFHNLYWPAKYIIDRDGNVRFTHFGEGEYQETESVIRYLLKQGGGDMPMASKVDFSKVELPSEDTQTGETYIGTDRQVIAGGLEMFNSGAAAFASPEAVSVGPQVYTKPQTVQKNQWWMTGEWKFSGEKAVSTSDEASIGLHYTAKQANLVMGYQGSPVDVEIWLDGKLIDPEDSGRMVQNGKIVISAYQLYFLTEHKDVQEHTVELKFRGKGVELYAWTFG